VTLPSDSDRAPAVYVDDVWVSFRVTREKNQTLKGTIASLRDRSKRAMLIEALRGVSFQVPAGSVYGVIGRNGAGKSTLLRTIAGILPPTAGRVAVWGRVTPLLSLGVGFNRELTGRDNILLGGLTAGLSAAEVYDNFAAVEEFAGLGDAIDFPMRTYSSGMFGRLAFSVAAHLRPEILLIDEALAAGDAAFKQKSMEKITELCEQQDCTVLIVSHGLEVVKALAEGCVWLDRGLVRMEGSATDVVAAYMDEEHIEATSMTALEDV
jgi:teichoic acid transport system ATP-binding protein